MDSGLGRIGEIAAVAPEVVEEAVEEIVGGSSKRWAVALVAFALGVGVTVGAIMLGRRRTAQTVRERDLDTPVVPSAPAAETENVSSSESSAAWSSRHPRIARSEARLRAGVTGIENHLHVRRHTSDGSEPEGAKP
jgi:hypothetical protein